VIADSVSCRVIRPVQPGRGAKRNPVGMSAPWSRVIRARPALEARSNSHPESVACGMEVGRVARGSALRRCQSPRSKSLWGLRYGAEMCAGGVMRAWPVRSRSRGFEGDAADRVQSVCL
jgi:hypothetical protein